VSNLGLFYTSKRLLWILIGIGVILRFVQYLYNRSLWADEASLALNITGRSFSELFQPLDYGQAAPLGFLALEKLAVQTFGNNEYALRLFPLLFGISSVLLFCAVAVRYIKPKAAPIALGLFAVSEYLVFYSSEVKQYSSDVVITLVLFLTAYDLLSGPWNIRRMTVFGVAGAMAIWFSHVAVFVLVGMGLTLALFCLVKKEWARLGMLLIAGSAWFGSFLVNYFVSLRDLGNNQWLEEWWTPRFMPFPPLSLSDLKWFYDTFFEIFETPLDFRISGVAAVAFLVGSYVIFREDRKSFLILMSPIPVALLASGLHKFPFYGRLLLFLIPSLLLFIAQGVEEIIDKTRHTSSVIGIVVIVLLLSYPLRSAGYALARPFYRAEMRPIMAYLQEHLEDRDVLYLHSDAARAFTYYSERYGLDSSNYTVGTGKIGAWSTYTNEIDDLRGDKRVWFVFSLHGGYSSGEEKFFLNYLDHIGTRIASFRSPRATLYLYDLDTPSDPGF